MGSLGKITCSPVIPVLGRGAETGKSLCLADPQPQCEALLKGIGQRVMSRTSNIPLDLYVHTHTSTHSHINMRIKHTHTKTAAMQIRSHIFFLDYEIDTKQ